MTDSRSNLITALAERCRIKRELGQGGMATVYGEAGQATLIGVQSVFQRMLSERGKER